MLRRSLSAWMLCVPALAAMGQPPPTRSLEPVNFSDVAIDSSFWSPRLETNRTISIPHNLDTCEETGRIDNFRHAAGVPARKPFQGHIFHDSDVYKVLEGVAYSLHTHPDPALAARLEEIVQLIAGSQQPDGYVNTWFTVAEPQKRWQDLGSAHELYCAGHLFEAAVAHYHATGRRTFLDVACRFADYIDSVFGPGKRYGIAGHPEIELALIRLWRATGEQRYLNLARFLVEEHGNAQHRELLGEYCQDHAPVRQQSEPVGHAVRLLYFYSGVADLAAIDRDQGYMDTMERLWHYIVDKKMYLTGGVGVQGHGEGFADAYFLPNYDAYCETCASIGMVFWNHRLALLHGDSRFADLVERLLYNGAISGISLDGSRFFYVNPLASRGDHHRQPWYGCACCPTNVVRFIASLGQYIYGALPAGQGVYVMQYIGSEVTVPLHQGRLRLVQTTQLPWEGSVTVRVEPDGADEFTIGLRIPHWCERPMVSINGQTVTDTAKDGFLVLDRHWKSGDAIHLELPMRVQQVAADPKVTENVGRRAIERGPVVYCFEDVDNPCRVDQVAIPLDARLDTTFQPNLLGGVNVVEVAGRQHALEECDDGFQVTTRDVNLTAIPYYAWDNRAAGNMVVWVPTELPAAAQAAGATVAIVAQASASHCWERDSVTALHDNVLPLSSSDHDLARLTWWDHRGTTEWVQYDFPSPQRLSATEIYWFDDTGRGSCRVPSSWRLLVKDGDDWRPVRTESEYGAEKDRWNRVDFEPETTTSIRLEVDLQPGYSGGILEWRLP